MGKKSIHKIIPAVILMIPVIFLYFTLKENKTYEDIDEKFRSEVFEINNGYGYRIIYKKKVLIKQDFIPAVSGKFPFHSYEDANNIANVVINRITSGEDPKVEKKDLDDLHIFIKGDN